MVFCASTVQKEAQANQRRLAFGRITCRYSKSWSKYFSSRRKWTQRRWRLTPPESHFLGFPLNESRPKDAGGNGEMKQAPLFFCSWKSSFVLHHPTEKKVPWFFSFLSIFLGIFGWVFNFGINRNQFKLGVSLVGRWTSGVFPAASNHPLRVADRLREVRHDRLGWRWPNGYTLPKTNSKRIPKKGYKVGPYQALRVLTPHIGVKSPQLPHLFSAIYRGPMTLFITPPEN